MIGRKKKTLFASDYAKQQKQQKAAFSCIINLITVAVVKLLGPKIVCLALERFVCLAFSARY